MVVSAAKLEANRRNAQKSTGPRTEEGRQRSSLNAVTHGMRAETLVLPEEDPQALEDRRAAWRACLVPGDEAEQRAVDDAVQYSWMQDRARRAQAARLNVHFVDDGVEEARAVEREVMELGRRLFTDRLGPLPFYPTGCDYDEGVDMRDPSTSFPGNGKVDPDHPAALVLQLQSTVHGCEWMLGEWAKLKATLDEGKPWISSDKLKAVRLLGKQPFDAIDDKDVALVFLASFALKSEQGSKWYWEIRMEMNDYDTRRFRQNAADRQLESLKPPDAAGACAVLLDLVERATQRLTEKADAHRERARVKAALAADCLAFDDSPAGERLRRHELASGRALARSLETLFKLRRSAKKLSRPLSPLSVVSGPLSDSGCDAETDTEANAPNEPTDTSGGWRVAGGEQENSTNEPGVSGGSGVEGGEQQNSTNLPTGALENVTNEPIDTSVGWRVQGGEQENSTNEPGVSGGSGVEGGEQENSTNEPNGALENVTNEPTAVCENATNEPTELGENLAIDAVSGPLSLVPSPLPGVTWDLEAVDERNAPNEPTTIQNPTNEPTGAGENVTNEPTEAERMPETLEHALARIRRRREEFVRALNEKERRKPRSIVGHGSRHGHTHSATLS